MSDFGRDSISVLVNQLVDGFPLDVDQRSSISDLGKVLFVEGQGDASDGLKKSSGQKFMTSSQKNENSRGGNKRSRDISKDDATALISSINPSADKSAAMHRAKRSASFTESKKTKARPKRWTSEEDRALQMAVEKHGEKNWKCIAGEVPGRNHTQCLQRWTKVLAPGLVKGHWREEEDELLKQLVAEGKKNWGQVAARIPGRTSKQCRERWYNHLDPTIRRTKYTEEEDKIIVETQTEIGNKWSAIASLLPGRTEDAVKIRWKTLCRNRDVSRRGQQKTSLKNTTKEEPIPNVSNPQQQQQLRNYQRALLQDMMSENSNSIINTSQNSTSFQTNEGAMGMKQYYAASVDPTYSILNAYAMHPNMSTAPMHYNNPAAQFSQHGNSINAATENSYRGNQVPSYHYGVNPSRQNRNEQDYSNLIYGTNSYGTNSYGMPPQQIDYSSNLTHAFIHQNQPYNTTSSFQAQRPSQGMLVQDPVEAFTKQQNLASVFAAQQSQRSNNLAAAFAASQRQPLRNSNPAAAFVSQQPSRSNDRNASYVSQQSSRNSHPVAAFISQQSTHNDNPALLFAKTQATAYSSMKNLEGANLCIDERKENQKPSFVRSSNDAARASASRRSRSSMDPRNSLDGILNELDAASRISFSDLQLGDIGDAIWRMSDDMNRLSL